MEYIAIIDTETTGLDPSKGKVLEIGAILFHIPTRSILSQSSTLLYAESNDAYEINRIEVDALKKVKGIIELSGISMIKNIMEVSDALIAHNAEFDKKWIETVSELQQVSLSKKWICTKNDVVWPIRKGVPLNLIHICADLGVPIINTHRALGDCLLLLEAINCMDDIENFLDKSGKGRITYIADITYENRQLAKDAGFSWDNNNKLWHAKMTPETAATMPFNVYPK